MAASLALSALPAAATVSGDIVTYAGSFAPSGAATNTGVDAADVAIRGTSMYVTEHRTVRRIDLTSRNSSLVAGTDRFSGLTGDGGKAKSARLGNYVGGVAVDGSGNVFVADTDNNRIRRIVPGTDGVVNGGAGEIISTVAGSTYGFSGDGGPATSARMQRPEAVTIDAGGNLIISTSYQVRRVAAGADGVVSGASDETITTVVGNGVQGFSGDGGPASLAELGAAFGTRFDKLGNLFIADGGNRRVRRIAPGADGIINGGNDETITTVAGGGAGADGSPATATSLTNVGRLAFSAAGDLFISEAGASRIRKVVTGGDGKITGTGNEILSTVAGTGVWGYSGDGGAATAAQVGYPDGLAFSSDGSLFFADGAQYRVRKIDAAGIITTAAGNGTRNYGGDGAAATKARLAAGGLGPAGVATDAAGNLFIADEASRVRRVSTSGVITTVAGGGRGLGGDGGRATAARLDVPQGVAFDGAGNLFIADGANQRVRKVLAGADGVVTGAPDEVITTVAGSGPAGYNDGQPGGFSGDGGPATSALLSDPRDVVVDRGGNLLIADTANHRIRTVTPAGIITTLAGNSPTGYTTQGGFSGDGGPATSAQLSLPYGVSVDSLGNVLIADALNNRIRKVTPAGIITTVAGSGPAGNGSARAFGGDGGAATSAILNRPYDVAGDGQGGFVIADNGNQRIRRVTPDGIITTVAGNSSAGGVSGDGGPATSARLAAPVSVALDLSGNIFISEQLRIRKVLA